MEVLSVGLGNGLDDRIREHRRVKTNPRFLEKLGRTWGFLTGEL